MAKPRSYYAYDPQRDIGPALVQQPDALRCLRNRTESLFYRFLEPVRRRSWGARYVSAFPVIRNQVGKVFDARFGKPLARGGPPWWDTWNVAGRSWQEPIIGKPLHEFRKGAAERHTRVEVSTESEYDLFGASKPLSLASGERSVRGYAEIVGQVERPDLPPKRVGG